ncbi:MAG: glycosyltransferase [Rhodocyclaceae bacterium]|nr:glycosyltransferase [Rhodocyclaceae bacterium]
MSATPAGSDPYQEWILSHSFQTRDGVDFEARIATWETPPRFHLAVAHDTASTQDLSRSLQALAGQYYPHLFVTVASPLPAPAGLPADRLAWIQAGDSWSAAGQALLSEPDATWVGLLRAGDAIAPHALLALAEHIVSNPGLAAIYTDEDILEDDGKRHSPRFKPDFDLELLRSANYLGGLILARRQAWHAAGGWQHFPQQSDEFDLALRLSEILNPDAIGHHADLLYHRHASHPAQSLEDAANRERLDCVNQHLQRSDSGASAVAGLLPGTIRVLYPLPATPRVSVIIPTRDQFALLERCVDTLLSQTKYPDFEVLIVDNGSRDPTACAYLEGIARLGDPRIRVIAYDLPFNFSAMNNLAAREATGSLLLLLNNDTAVLHEDWLDEMVSLALQPAVGAVGARLLHPDGTIQHAGVVLGLAGPAEHPFIGWPNDRPSVLHRTHASQQFSAVTAACMLISKELYMSVGGMDEDNFKVSYNDVDLCLKVKARGKRILWTPYATLLHEGSATQRQGEQAAPPSPEKLARFATEQEAMYRRWLPHLTRDPAHNPNLSLSNRDVVPEPEAALSSNPTPWNPRPRLLVHPIDQTGSGEYRILAPSRALHNAGRCRGYASQRFFSPVEIAKAELDSIVIQHPTSARHLTALEIYRRYSGARCIVEIDDLITDIPRSSPHYRILGKEAGTRFRQALEIADQLVVSTQPLAEAFGCWAREVVVQPNRLERSRWGGVKAQPRTGSRKPRVGWTGSNSHVGDLRLLLPVVKKLAREVDWVFFGLCLPELKPYAAEMHPPVAMAEYPRKLAELGLDVAIAPLEIHPFNEAKSALKILEYGILGYPVVCTDILPYQGAFPVTRVRNAEQCWISAIRDLALDPVRRVEEGRALQAHIQAYGMLEDRLEEWAGAWLPQGGR